MAVFALLAVTVGFVARCGDDSEPTEILLRVLSEVDVDTVEISARNIEYDDDVISKSVSDRDLTREPLLILISPTRKAPFIAPADDVGFLVQVRGLADGQTVVAASRVLTFTRHRRVEETFDMLGLAGLNDADGDGFASCLTNPSDPLCDCVDQNSQINPFTKEICLDSVDNNCSGFPPDEGCPCVDPKPCTNLPENIREQHLGNGICGHGTLACIDGNLSETCEFEVGDGRPASSEICDNGLDDDCDGAVDEGCGCSTGDSRDCFMGWVDDNARGRALGECELGQQQCESGTWAASCTGERRPTRLPDGVGYAEFVCDGLDNDCDGFFDEEPGFDADRDGFTICGTCIDGAFFNPDPADPRRLLPDERADGSLEPSRFIGLIGGQLCAEDIDCDDAWADIRPHQAEDCREIDLGGTVRNYDDDCRCDHGSNLGGPSIAVGGASNCVADGSLNCALSGPRSDATTVDRCDDELSGLPYYFGFHPADDTGSCNFCAGDYGTSCDPAEGRCSTRSEDCTGCTNGLRAEERPACTAPRAGTCTETIAPIFDFVSQGTDDPEPSKSCDGKVCNTSVPTEGGGPFYFGIDADMNGNARCYYHADVSGVCDGSGFCMQRQDECQQAPKGAPIPEIGAPASGLPHRPRCQFPSTGCSGQTPPVFGAIARGQDPYDDCDGTATCDGGGFCHAQPGDECVSLGRLCEADDFCVDGVCCEQACTGSCQACIASLTAAADGTCAAIDMQVADDEPSGLCIGTNGCSRGPCVCQATTGGCLSDDGTLCTGNGDCASGFCRLDWDQGQSFCAKDGTSCVYDGDGDSGTAALQRSSDWVQCNDANGGYRVCRGGVWDVSRTNCAAALCAPGGESLGCGWVSAASNSCKTGEGLGTGGGCDYGDLGSDYTCQDCSDFTATTTGCNGTLINCDINCGAVCESGDESGPRGKYCQGGASGNSYNRIDVCAETGGTSCDWDDNGVTANDELNQDCGAMLCDTGTGDCYVSCSDDNGRCENTHHCEGSSCVLDLAAGSACDEASDCLSNYCRLDWAGSNRFCAQDATHCVDDDGGGTVRQHANLWRECDGTDGWRACDNGVWLGASQCDAVLCTPATDTSSSCGFFADTDNVCSSGQGGAGGCGTVGACNDCGDFTATTSGGGGCNTFVIGNCLAACGAQCDPSSLTQSTSTLRCNPDASGDSFTKVDACRVSGILCEYYDDGFAQDTLADDCGNINCNIVPGQCLASCASSDANCNAGYHCTGTTCQTVAANGEPCTTEGSDTGCASTYCRRDHDGTGLFCAENSSGCVHDHDGAAGTAAQLYDTGYVLCVSDSHRTCTNGSWSGTATACNAETCDPTGSEASICGYVTDVDNACISGQGTGGCELDLGAGFTCGNCGDLEADPGACKSSGILACNKSCGADCVSGETNNTGTRVCRGGVTGDSWIRVDVCNESGQSCTWLDDGVANDASQDSCAPYECDAGGTEACLSSCDSDADCLVGNYCFGAPGGSCVGKLADGKACVSDGDCASDDCHLDWDGLGRYCATDSTTCVHDHDSSGDNAQMISNGDNRCVGDFIRSCSNGAWGSAACDVATCAAACDASSPAGTGAYQCHASLDQLMEIAGCDAGTCTAADDANSTNDFVQEDCSTSGYACDAANDQCYSDCESNDNGDCTSGWYCYSKGGANNDSCEAGNPGDPCNDNSDCATCEGGTSGECE